MLRSSLRAVPAGTVIPAGGRLTVPANAHVLLLLADGQVQQLTGPVRHEEGAAVPRAGVFDAFRAMLQVRQDPQRLGGVRGTTAECAMLAANWADIAQLWNQGCKAQGLQLLETQLIAIDSHPDPDR